MTKPRADIAQELAAKSDFDVVVIGGGVNGIGVYRDLSLQGVRVLLVEKNDFASGCSAAPSRMIHGGLRYLENGEFDLVRESLQERDALLTNAPHMVRPLPTVIPIESLFSGLLNSAASFFGFSGKPKPRGLLPIKMGLGLYDLVTRKRRILPTHKVALKSATRKRWPHLTRSAKFSAVFYDAWISHPERLCVEMLKDTAAAAPQSVALNYAELKVDGPSLSVTDHVSGQTMPVSAKVIVNATGAWLDRVAQEVDPRIENQMVSGTKGSHLIIENDALMDALDGHMVYFENADGRICIVFPYLGKVLAGSTDIRVNQAGRVRCEPEEQSYIVDSLNLVFDGIEVTEDQVVYSYSGIRPLPKSDQDFTGRISRGHYIKRIDGAIPQFCMIGGKWTTFRAFGEQTADDVLAELGQTRSVSTLDMPIGGGKQYIGSGTDLAARLVETYGVTPERAAHLLDHYGSQAMDVQAYCAAMGDDAALGDGTAYTAAEIEWLVKHEFATNVADIVMRRTSLAITGSLTADLLDRVSAIVRDTLSLTDAQAAQQRQALVDELERYNGVSALALTRTDDNRSIECA